MVYSKEKGGVILELKSAYFAGGCFWCITPTFQEMVGVRKVTSGYCGGQEENPSYLDVKHQRTGHRETIRIEYNPEKLSYRDLVRVFLNNVDPFDAGGQYIDRGHSYTLAVYFETESEHQIAREEILALEAASGRPVAIPTEPFAAFYTAEEEHQDYYLKYPEDFRQELILSGRLKE